MSMQRLMSVLLSTIFASIALVGCVVASHGVPAPVEDRTISKPRAQSASTTKASVVPVTSENVGKPGFYTVKPNDTLIRIGLDQGQNWRDLVRWNNIENPNNLEVGQVLRVVPPGTTVTPEGVVVRPVTSPTTTTLNQPINPATAVEPQKPSNAVAQPPTEPTKDAITFIWPAQGGVLTGFDEAKNKGIDISGKAGDPVLASADGRVVYAGSDLRGYGNLIILKHNNTFLTAYAHNQTILVREDQSVKRGQKIAEMGNSDADQVKLHFEIRRTGKPVDPLKFLAVR
ncbi:MAG: LysM peptidoglycan-binding domain-containing protein [Limnohabitans sp.]|nr:LysM peptidoglycan-binding domain-containing protein [Limnohabitans sp.]